jgi:hypothetical protein
LCTTHGSTPRVCFTTGQGPHIRPLKCPVSERTSPCGQGQGSQGIRGRASQGLDQGQGQCRPFPSSRYPSISGASRSRLWPQQMIPLSLALLAFGRKGKVMILPLASWPQAGSDGAGDDATPRYFLMKSEPNEFGIDDLAAQPGGTHHWEGVSGAAAAGWRRAYKVYRVGMAADPRMGNPISSLARASWCDLYRLGSRRVFSSHLGVCPVTCSCVLALRSATIRRGTSCATR